MMPSHRLRSMSGRDPLEAGRAASTLELLFDLTFVIGFGTAASQFAHYLAEGHVAVAVVGFVFRSVRRRLGLDELVVVRVGL